MNPETRDFLATVRGAEDPSPADESRVLAALQGTIAGSPMNAGPKSASTTKGVASGAGSALKILGALLGVSVGAALVVSAVSSDPIEPKVVSLSQRAPVANAPVSPRASVVSSSAPLPNASVASVASARAATRSVPPVSRAAAPATTGVESGARAAASSSASLREEIALLTGVQSALERGDGAEALRRLDQHVTNDRQFIAERRAARIAALCQLGRVSDAQQLAVVFLRENAQSVQRTAVERSCAVPKPNAER